MNISRASLLCLLGIGVGAFAQTPGSADLTFHPADQGYGMGAAFNHLVSDIAFQADGKAIVVGAFSGWNGLPLNAPQGGARGITRLTTSGVKDPSFGPTTSAQGFNTDSQVRKVEVLADGSIIAIGTFTSFGGVSRNRIIKLTPNGTLDASFQVGTGFDTTPLDLCVQADGKVVVVGASTYNGVACNGIVRLNTDGSHDNTLQTGTAFSGSPISVACNWSGIFVGGSHDMSYNGSTPAPVVQLSYTGLLMGHLNPPEPWGRVGHQILATDQHVAVVFQYYSSFEIHRFLWDGTLDAAFAGITGTGYEFDLQPAANGGYFFGSHAGTINGQPHVGLVKITEAGLVDASFNPSLDLGGSNVTAIGVQTDGKVIALVNTQGPYDLVHSEGRSKPGILRFSSTGALDAAYSPGYGFHQSHWSSVRDMVVQPDGRIIAAGSFRSYDQYRAGGLCRINADGTWDASFLASGVQGITPGVFAVALQPDGRILVGGSFSSFNGQAHGRLVRLLADGSTDNSFSFGAGLDEAATVHAILVQPDGKILLAGRFTTLNGAACGDVVRLNANGTVDGTFSGPSVTSPNNDVLCMDLLPDGRLYIGGSFTALNSVTRNRAARLNANGTVDATFNTGTGFDGVVYCSYLLPDGRVLFGGNFSSYNGTGRTCVASCLSSGAIDPAIVFNLSPFRGIWDIQRQSNGKFLLCGKFYTGNGSHDLARFHANGQVDATFHTDASSYDFCSRLAILPSGKIILAGPFVRIASGGVEVGRNGIARLHGGDPQVILSARALLDGPFDQAVGTMTDDLRSAGLLPLMEPYSTFGATFVGNGGGESTTSAVLAVTGNNAIVDWVVVELRDPVAPATVLASRAALLQRDGDIVDLDGISALQVYGNAQLYHVAVRHRNHLGVMTASPLQLSTGPTILDLSDASTASFGTNACKAVGGRMVLWAGDVSGNGQVKYTGAGNDRDVVLQAIGGSTPTNTVAHVYSATDVNMDGTIQYTGAGNDRDPILSTIGGSTPTMVRHQQLP